MKTTIIVLGIILLAGTVFFALNSYIYKEKQATVAPDHKNAEYVIDGERVELQSGYAETEAAPGSSAKIITRYFGNELTTDLNDDGREDIVFLLTQERGGSGTFYYAVAAQRTEKGYVGSEAYFLGDRIAPQGIELSASPNHENVIVINYADRALGEPMTTAPSVGKSVWLKFDPETMQWGVVEQNFEGEADPARMTLAMKEWVWVSALYNDDTSIEPREAGGFTLTFTNNGRFFATTDCNSMSGSYAADGYSITMSNIAMTKMHCQESQETEFLSILEDAQLYHFTSRGELVFDLQFDSGIATFR